MKRAPLVLLIAASVLAGASVARNFWETKPYTQWKKKEAEQLLRQSPWTVEYQWGYIGSIAGNITGMGDPEREFITIIRIHLYSAHTVRQAYACLTAKGDPARQERLKGYVQREYPREIVISWTLDSVPKGVSAVFDVQRTLSHLNINDLKNNTFLATNLGKKVYIQNYLPPGADGSEAKFVFPRNLPDGTPLITPDDKTLKFQTLDFQIKLSDQPQDIPQGTLNRTMIQDGQTLRQDILNIDATFYLRKLLVNGEMDY